MFSKQSFHTFRYYGSMIAITSVLLVFLTSIPGIGTLSGIHEFGLFLMASLVSILLIDIFVIDMLGIIESQVWRTLFFGLLMLLVLGLVGSILLSYYQISIHFFTYICYGSGIVVFCYAKKNYHRSSLYPNMWGLVQAGSSTIAIFLSICFASYILSIGSIQDINCHKLQEYSRKVFVGSSTAGLVLGGDTSSAGRMSFSLHDLFQNSSNSRQHFKTLYIDDLLSERKILSQNACEVIFTQISNKIKEHKQRIQISLLLLVFFLLWPFVVFFIRIETILAYGVLSGLVQLGCYHKKKETHIREYRV